MQTSPIVEAALNPLWIAQPVLQSTLAGVMLKHKLHRRYPYFFAYVVAQIVNFAVLFPLHFLETEAYFYAYWISTLISVALGFRVIYEVFTDVLKPFHALRDFASTLFHWASVVVVLIAWVTAMTNPGTNSRFMTIALLSVEQSVRIMQCAMALFLIMFSSYLGISRRHPSFAIALGFGVFAGVKFALLGVRALGTVGTDGISAIVAIAYCISIMLWVGFLWRPETNRSAAETLPQTWRWDHSLGELTHPVAPEALMPMFDTIVDRALSRAEETKTSQNRNNGGKTSDPEHVSTSSSLGNSAFAAAMAAGHRS